ncbi:hypothetical protein [Streptomyces sp. CAI-24]|uniref:hypothetical protein n=1 Tax=Streptomyces sp. CAI-24 TaxID=2712892 RepID=UPI0015865E5A|nr:hypothetical protein [Streptomyces sp. CAI-24]
MQDRYHVVAGPPLSPQGTPAEELEGLAEALSALTSPAVAAVQELPVSAVELAFNSLLPKGRQQLLDSLGIRIAAPRRASKSLCRDVLGRLQRDARQHECTCGVKTLTHTVMNQVGQHACAPSGDAASDPVSRWGAPLVRATVFVWCNASVGDAHTLAWAADHDWFAGNADEDEKARFDKVGQLAREIAAAYPNFEPGMPGERGTTPEDGTHPGGIPQAAVDTVPAEAAGAGKGAGPEPDELCRELESGLALAREAAEKVMVAVADGSPPQDEDLLRLTALNTLFDRAEAAFGAAGIKGVSRRLEDMVRAAEAHRAVSEQDVLAREALRELLDVVSRTGSTAASATEAAREVARSLLRERTWGEEQREESTALLALARIVRLGRQADAAAEILALQEQVVRVLPACAMAAVMATDLSFPRPEAALRMPPGVEAEAETDEGPDGATDEEPAEGLPSASTDPALADDAAAHPREATPDSASEKRTAPPVETVREPVGLAIQQPAVSGGSAPAAVLGIAPTSMPTSAIASPGVPTAASMSVAAPPPIERAPSPGPAHAQEPSRQGDSLSVDGETDEESGEGAATERVLARLIVERRFGLAHQMARAAGRPEPQTAALRLAGAAALLSSGDSRGARLITDLLESYGGYAGRDTEGSELLLLPALLRTALITGDHLAGAQLKALVPRLPDRLGGAATAVADRALSGALIASPLVVIADDAERDARLAELRDHCNTLLAPQRLRFARATEIAKRWLSPGGGLLGSLLTAVANDDRGEIQHVREQAERLSKLAEVNSEIDRMDRKYRSSSGKPLQGSGRQDLVHLVERAVGPAKEWCLVVDGTRGGDRSDRNRAVKEISALRQSLLDGKDGVLAELKQLAGRSAGLAAATAWAARASMKELYALLTGDNATMRTGGPIPPEVVLDAELLKVCDSVEERPSSAVLLAAVDRGWPEAIAERLDQDAFTAVRTIVELAGRGVLPAARAGEFLPPALTEVEERESTRRVELRGQHDELVAELHRAQADGAVTDDQDLRLQELLADAEGRLDKAETHDLAAVRRGLDTVRSSLPDFRREAADRIRARLDVLDSTPDQRAQVLRSLETNDLATAADLVYFLEIGEDVPEIENGESHLAEFFPAVPDGLRGGIDRNLIDLVRSCGTHPDVPTLDYSALSTDEAALAADALDEWRLMGTTEPKDRLHVAHTRRVPPLLKLLGYDAKSARQLDERSQNRREYRLFEATDVVINGRAKAPAFGSQIREHGGNLRVMMVWGRPPAKVVMSWAERDTSGTSLVVLYFGTLSREARIELAVGSGQLSQPLLVVDDAALAYLAAHGNRQVSIATQTLLPFSGVNPYIREKRGRIGGEMFYGRDAERKSILDPRGTQVIFGGRGLGKSALLADAGDKFMEQYPDYHLSVYVNLDQENIGKGSSLGPETLWSVLDRKLTEAQVLGPPQGRKPVKDISERVRAGIQAWTDGDSRRRLLILLDECDQFFEADAPRFNQTKKLKGLGDDTKDRAKVVFAGLHSVQRFSKMASNGPFGHLAQTPKVIGPLAPQFAAELLVEPMRALGFEFLDLDLVNRVLGYCSYQPFLLQMFGHRLVEVMHRKRARRGPNGPVGPLYKVELADIEVVESDTGLRDSISAAFKDTLSLDHRYDVIANVLAYHARHHGLEVRLSDTELREECETYWRKGFEQLDTEGFRAYLSEMVGLGILAPNHDGLGWHLRGPSALRMIGSSHEVEARLLRAEQDCELQESIVLEGRPELPDGRPAPLTITQLDDLLGERSNQARVVLGSAATGVTDVGDTLRRVAGRIADWKLPAVGNGRVYRQELMGGAPRERRVVISDFANYPARPETCREAVEQAETLLPGTPGVTRAVVLITDVDQLDLWRTLLTGAEHAPAAPVVLRRHDRRSLRGWAQRVEMFHTEDRLDRLHELTGGWPLLVDRAHRLHGELGDADKVFRQLADIRTGRAGARAFTEATGIYADPLLAAGYQALAAEFKEDRFDLVSAVTAVALTVAGLEDEEEARWIVSCLDALQVFDREDGHLRLEPFLRECVTLCT